MTFRPSVLPTRDNTIIDTFTRTFNATQRAIALDQANKRADREFEAKRQDQDLRNEQAILASNLAVAQEPGLSFENRFSINQEGTTAQVTADAISGPGRQVVGEAVGPTLGLEQEGVSVGRGPGGQEIFFSLEKQQQAAEEALIDAESLKFRLGADEREREATQLAAETETRFNALLTVGQFTDTRLSQQEIQQAQGSETATNAILSQERANTLRLNTPSAETAAGLRAEFERSPIAKEALAISGSYASLIETLSIPSSGPNDLSVIFSFMKMLDPGSVVREGEFANAANSQGAVDRLIAMVNRISRGERLSRNARIQFELSARAIIRGRRKILQGHIDRFSGFAENQNVKPSDVVFNAFDVIEGIGPEDEPGSSPGVGGTRTMDRILSLPNGGIGDGQWAGSGGVALEDQSVVPADPPGEPLGPAPVGTGSVLLPTPGVDLPDTVIDSETGEDLGDGLDNAERMLQLFAEGKTVDQAIEIMRGEDRLFVEPESVVPR